MFNRENHRRAARLALARAGLVCLPDPESGFYRPPSARIRERGSAKLASLSNWNCISEIFSKANRLPISFPRRTWSELRPPL
jgi:hypothetical protein